MTDLPLIALGGLLGSSHCLGMCGPFALTIGLGTRPWASALSRQLAYSFGRIFTYSCAGTVAAYGGLRLVGRGSTFGQTQAVLCVVAGVLLIVQGLSAANVLPRFHFSRGATTSCGAFSHFGCLLRSPKTSRVFLAGVATGFLPCGLVYAYLALAAATADVGKGLATMAVFGAGTIPMMALAGLSGRLVNLGSRRRLFRLAAYCVVLTGALSVYRGVAAFSIGPSRDAAACPFCRSSQ